MKKAVQIFAVALSILAIMVSCSKRTTFEIVGTAEGMADGVEIVLKDAINFQDIDRAIVKDGQFRFEGRVEQPKLVNMYFERMYLTLVLENAEYKVVKNEYLNYADGGEINNLVFGYALEESYRKMKKEHALAPDPFDGVDMMDKEALEKARKVSHSRMRKEFAYKEAYQSNIVEGDYPSLVKLFTLSNIQNQKEYDHDKKLKLLSQYEKELGPHPLLVANREGILKAKKTQLIQASVAPGKPFKDVVGQAKDGTELKLSDAIAKNKYTLLEMWSSWCGPCRGEFPHLKKAYSKYHDKGFEIFAISLDTKKKAWLKALEEENVPWINVVDYKGFKGDAPQAYGVNGIPASFLIDQDGTIVATMQQVRGFALDEKLKELFKE